MNKTEIICLGITLLTGIAIGLFISIFNLDTCHKNKRTIACIHHYLQAQDKNYQSSMASCKTQQEEQDRKNLRSLAE